MNEIGILWWIYHVPIFLFEHYTEQIFLRFNPISYKSSKEIVVSCNLISIYSNYTKVKITLNKKQAIIWLLAEGKFIELNVTSFW